jgi:hypothetical protein
MGTKSLRQGKILPSIKNSVKLLMPPSLRLRARDFSQLLEKENVTIFYEVL